LVASATNDVPLEFVEMALLTPSSETKANTRIFPLGRRIALGSATWPLLDPKVDALSAVPTALQAGLIGLGVVPVDVGGVEGPAVGPVGGLLGCQVPLTQRIHPLPNCSYASLVGHAVPGWLAATAKVVGAAMQRAAVTAAITRRRMC